MPAGDGTGPTGMGPMTGFIAGYCAGYAMPGCMNPVSGRTWGGFGRGRGGGRHGWRHRFHATGLPFWARVQVPEASTASASAPLDEVQALKSQAGQLEQTLERLRHRIAEIESAQAGRQ